MTVRRARSPVSPRRAGALAAALAIILSGVPAAAQAPARPPLHPSRDVDVTYRLAGGQRNLTERMRWLAAAQRQRVDPPTTGLFVLIDYRAGRMSTVRLSDRLVLEMAAPPSAAGTYVRQGEDHVAGLACTDWEATATDGRRTIACITDDGVMLRASADGHTLLSAVSVSYAPQDPALFAVPEGFTVRTMAAPKPAAPQ